MSYKLRPPIPGKSEYWTARITPPNGTRFERSTRCTRKSDADKVAAQWDREAAVPSNQVAQASVTLEAALEFLRTDKLDKKQSESSIGIIEEKAPHLLGYFGTERLVHTIELAHTEGYMRHRRKKGVSDRTIEMELGYLRQALKVLRRKKLYTGHPGDIMPDQLKPGPPRDRWLPPDEVEKLLEAMGPVHGYYRDQYGTGERHWVDHEVAMGNDWRDWVVAYLYTGMRLSELLKLTRQHVSADFGELHNPGTKTVGAKRMIPIHAELDKVLRRRVKLYPSGRLFPSPSPNYAAHKNAWLRALKRGCARAGIEPVSTNDLRRTFCSWCFQNSVPETLLIKWMGHTSNKMIRQVYAQASSSQSREAMANLPHMSPNAKQKKATRGNARQSKSPRKAA
jgi:integrase